MADSQAKPAMPVIRGDFGDADFPDKARKFFLDLYRLRRDQVAALPPPAPPAHDETNGWIDLHLGLDNLPEEHLPPEQFLFLVETRHTIWHRIRMPMAETDDPCVAAILVMRQTILDVAYTFIDHLLLYLMLDVRFHPERNLKAKALGILGYDGMEDDYRGRLNSMMGTAACCNLLCGGDAPNAAFAEELRILHLAGDIFFDTLLSVFPLQTVGKCRRAFNLLMQGFGSTDGCAQVENYIRRRKTMHRDCVNFERNGGLCAAPLFVSPSDRERCQQLNENVIRLGEGFRENTEAIKDVVKVVGNMDRRQRDALAWMKRTVSGFIGLFRPGSRPSRAEVEQTLAPVDRYACLSGYGTGKATQLKAVIDMTYAHPISRQVGKRKGVFTLANAIRDLWDRNEDRWVKMPDAYLSYEALKRACYDLAESKENPFRYEV